MNSRWFQTVSLLAIFLSGCDKEKETKNKGENVDLLLTPPVEVLAGEMESNSTSERKASWKELIRQSESCVVSLFVENKGGAGTGTGFFVKDDGLVVTNYHVVADASSIKAKNFQGYTLVCRGILAVDEKRDLALLDFAAKNVPTLPLFEGEKLEKGEEVLAIGSPLGLEISVTRGIVSALRDEKDTDLVQFDAAASQGSSGSPLLNQAGEVVGVISSGVVARQGHNFAVASNHLADLLEASESMEVVTFAEFFYDPSLVEEPQNMDVEEDVELVSAEGLMTDSNNEHEVMESEEDQELDNRVEGLNQFWSKYWDSFQNPTGSAWAVLFLESSDYQYKEGGKASRAEIAKGAFELKGKYPDRFYKLLSGPNFVDLKSSNRIGFDFDYEYFYANSSKVVGGISKTELALTWSGEEWLIDKFRETIEKYEHPERILKAKTDKESSETNSTTRVKLREKEAGYMATSNGSALIWNNSYRAGDSASWSGRVDEAGYANGVGKLSWFKFGSFQYSYTGRMNFGKFDGPVTTVDWQGHSGRGQYKGGRKAGRWYFVSRDGKRRWSKNHGN